MEARSPHATIQWDFREVTSDELSGDPRSHPGYSLARAHCTRCHLPPTPDQLPRDSWVFVLTWMANYLGYPNFYGPFEPIVDSAVTPPGPLLSPEEFRAIADYYLVHATDESDWTTPAETHPVVSQFTAETPDFDLPPEGLITLVHYDEGQRRFYLGDGRAKRLRIHEADGELVRAIELESEPAGIEVKPDGFRIGLLGDFMADFQRGTVVEFDTRESPYESRTLVRDFHRLTQALSADLNQDGADDLLLVGFGQGSKGKVAVRWGGPDGVTTNETVLLDRAGGLNAVVHDFAGNGRPDVLLLTSQGEQELLLFVNEGDGAFRRELILKRFAGFGFNHLTIADFNADGRMDLVLVNGNNMEIKNAPVKPYHGVRVLENEGGLRFTEKAFLPLPGALKTVARDFDGDGDVDLAAIAFYPDWSHETPQTFAYFENRGGHQFVRSVLPSGDWGHWISLDAADVDGDGHEDLLLGGGYISNGVHTAHRDRYQAMIRNKPSVVVLRNVGVTQGSNGERR